MKWEPNEDGIRNTVDVDVIPELPRGYGSVAGRIGGSGARVAREEDVWEDFVSRIKENLFEEDSNKWWSHGYQLLLPQAT